MQKADDTEPKPAPSGFAFMSQAAPSEPTESADPEPTSESTVQEA